MGSESGGEGDDKSEVDDTKSTDNASDEEMRSQEDKPDGNDDDDDDVASKSSCSTYVSDEVPGVVVDLRNRTFKAISRRKVRGTVEAVVGLRGKLLLFKSNKTCDVYDIETDK